jgi:2-oxoglutarate dehydrogenase E2 component (dihydrolipoamide succinyltransferase)
MTTPLLVPALGESVVEATISVWHKKIGDTVRAGDVVVELETDKVNLDVEAPIDGILSEIAFPEGADVNIGDVLAQISPSGAAPASVATPAPAPVSTPAPAPSKPAESAPATPVARRIASAEGVDLSQLAGSGSGGKITKEDVQGFLASSSQPSAPSVMVSPQPSAVSHQPVAVPPLAVFTDERGVERVKMSRRRRTIAQRLVEAQHNAAMLTTFNEVDMSAVMTLRQRHKQKFEERTGARLGFMSFFTKAAVAALKKFPRLNAEIDGDEMVIKQYYDIGIAVGAEEGLVVPVVRNADRKSFAAIEDEIRQLGQRARTGELTLEELMGGSFTITNGGIFGSMLSTPILNAPQVGILGLHNIVERPVVVAGEIVVRPIMYVALSYDHRIVDGGEAVRFLYTIKELIEDPERLLLEG